MSVLKGLTSFYEHKISDNLTYNLKTWLSYGFLQAGAYTPVKFDLATSGYTNLQRVKDERYVDGRVYEGFGPGWVWESGVSVPTGLIQPFNVSGVYVNSTFYPLSASGTYSHIIDYERGRVIFNNAISSSSTVKCEYVFRDIAIYPIDTTAWKTVVSSYSSRYDSTGQLSPSGIASILKENRVWLPAVFIDVKDRSHTGLQLGGGELADCGVFYHIFSDRPSINKILVDVINDQENKVLNLFDMNQSPIPLNYDGSLRSGAKTYIELSDRDGIYFQTYAWIKESVGRQVGEFKDLFRGECRHNIIIERYGF